MIRMIVFSVLCGVLFGLPLAERVGPGLANRARDGPVDQLVETTALESGQHVVNLVRSWTDVPPDEGIGRTQILEVILKYPGHQVHHRVPIRQNGHFGALLDAVKAEYAGVLYARGVF